MKKANKFLASTLALTMALTAVAPISAFAADSDKTIKVSQSFAEEFVLTIPDGTESLEEGQSFELSAYAFLDYGEELAVSVTSENGWKLTDAKYAENSKSIAYEMMLDGKVLTAKTEEVLAVPYDAANHTKAAALVVKSVAEPEYAGTYEDILTFTTALKNADKASQPRTVETPKEEPTTPQVGETEYNVTAIPNSTDAHVKFCNPEDNEGQYLTFEIRMEDESEQGYEVLYTSGLVAPGQEIRRIDLSRGFDEEGAKYDAILHIQAYNMDEQKTASDTYDIPIVISVATSVDVKTAETGLRDHQGGLGAD